MSNAARQQLGLQTEKLRIKTKNEHLPSHDLCQNVMMQDLTNKRWSPVVITKLCKEPRSYQVTTKEGRTYRKMQAHLKPYKPDYKQDQAVKKCYTCTLTKTMKRTLIIVNWHSQELGGTLSTLSTRSIIKIMNILRKLVCHKF